MFKIFCKLFVEVFCVVVCGFVVIVVMMSGLVIIKYCSVFKSIGDVKGVISVCRLLVSMLVILCDFLVDFLYLVFCR